MTVLQRKQTILYEIQQACVQLNLASPSTVYLSSDETSIMMGSVANLAGIMVNESKDWQMMQGTFSCVGDDSTTQFPLPSHIVRFINQTGWSSSKRRPVVILNNQQWAAISAWLSQSFFVNPACRINNDVVEFMSAPATGETVSFQYVKSTWVLTAGVTPTDILSADTDVPMFDWLLMVLAIKLKYKEMKGLDTAGAQSDFNDRLLQLTQNDNLAPILLLNGRVNGSYRYLDSFFNAPDTNLGS